MCSSDLVPRSPRFVDLVSGKRALYDTRAAVMWDEENMYVGFWLEEPDVQGDLTERDAPIFTNNEIGRASCRERV